MTARKKKFWESESFLFMEWVVLFFGFPLAYFLFPHAWGSLGPIPSLLAWTIYALVFLLLRKDFAKTKLLHPKGAKIPWRKIFLRFLFLGGFIAAFTAFAYPKKMFWFVTHHPGRWALVMLLYPLLSVYPQNVVYRAFFHFRYKKIFSSPTLRIVFGALSFGFMHIIFRNPMAVTFTIVGGFLFAQTYEETDSLLASSIEHALYGTFLITIGLGEFFYLANKHY